MGPGGGGFTAPTFSPREIAEITGLSESSIKRWIDTDELDLTRTAGGHRRVPLYEVVRFIRTRGLPVVRPERLALHVTPIPRARADVGTYLETLLQEGTEREVRGLIVGHYLAGGTLAELFDGPLSEAMEAIGTLWREGAHGVFLEHRATMLLVQAISFLHHLLPPTPPGAPVAIGGAPEGDRALLPSLMCDTILTAAGYRTVNLGAYTPVSAFVHAVTVARPALVWISITHDVPEPILQELFAALTPLRVVLGGRSALRGRGRWPRPVTLLPDMHALEAFATRRPA